jgi:hypothetical protein
MPQDPVARLLEHYLLKRERDRLRATAPDLARHARRFPKQHREIHLDRFVPEMRVLDDEASAIGDDTDDGKRAALALADRP